MPHVRAPRFLTVFAAAALLSFGVTQASASIAHADDFDVTGSLDCGAPSGQKCVFQDWETGPVLAIFTEDVSGEMMCFEVDASWVRDDLDSVRQDDFVWLVVRDGIGPLPHAVGVVQRHCNDGRHPHGQVNQGQATGQRCG